MHSHLFMPIPEYHEHSWHARLREPTLGSGNSTDIVLRNAMLAFNILRKKRCDLLSLPGDLQVKFDVGLHRIKSVIQNIVNVVGKLIKTGGRTMLKISRKYPCFDPFERLFVS